MFISAIFLRAQPPALLYLRGARSLNTAIRFEFARRIKRIYETHITLRFGRAP
jgi:hypothetical protein